MLTKTSEYWMSLNVILNRLNLSKENISHILSSGIKTVLDFLQEDDEELISKLHLSQQVIEQIKDLIYSEYASVPVLGTDLYEETFRLTKTLSTGCENLDKLLHGGIYTRELTELYGPPASGKTQVAIWLSYHVTSTLPVHVLYIDTSGAFTMERFLQFVQLHDGKQINAKEYLSKLRRVRLLSAIEVIAFLYQLKKKLEAENDVFYFRVKLIILDSIASVITPILNSETKEGYILMRKMSMLLKQIAQDYGIAVLITNNAVSNYFDKTKPSNQLWMDKYKPTLGVTWLPVPSVRLFIDKVQGKDREIRIDKHSRLATRSVTLITISARGVCNGSSLRR